MSCLLQRFEEDGEHCGFADLVSHQRRLLHPIAQTEASPTPRAVSFDHVMDALRGANEFELYVLGCPGASANSASSISVSCAMSSSTAMMVSE